MHKRIVAALEQESIMPEQGWLNLEALAEVEVTSEEASHTIEGALLPNLTSGWRASGPGKQTIRLIFAHPQRLNRIRLTFVEAEFERTQEYVLRWSPGVAQPFSEIVRQQWNFSPSAATSETEDYRVELPAVAVLELSIIPDMSGRYAIASLAQLRLA